MEVHGHIENGIVVPHRSIRMENENPGDAFVAAQGDPEAMPIEASGAYRDGAIYTDQPLPLPDNTPVRVLVVPKAAPSVAPPIPFPTTPTEILAIRPQSPRITPEEFRALVEKHSVSVGSLPADFSRADIYSEHD